MIGTGLMRAPRGRRPIWPIAIAGLVVSQVLLTAPALAGAARTPDSTIGVRSLVNCGGGIQAVNITLPAGFDVLTASQAELVGNGLPARPSGRVELATWKRFVTGGVTAAPSRCALTAAAPTAAPLSIIGDVTIIGAASIIGDASLVRTDSIIGDSTNIVGDTRIIGDSIIGDTSIIGDATPQSIIGDTSPADAAPLATAASAARTGFLDTYGTWRVRRAFRHTAHGSTGLAPAGLGLGTGSSAADPKVEAGSAARGPAVAGRYHYYLWWRVYPQQARRVSISLAVTPGDTVYAHIRLGHGQALITVRDESSGAGGTFLVHLAKLAG
jgi:hypothetical protein